LFTTPINPRLYALQCQHSRTLTRGGGDCRGARDEVGDEAKPPQLREGQVQLVILDILVSFRVKPGLIQFVTLEQHLTDLLGVTVDLVMESALKPDIAARIQADRKPV
jgi:hypothetical protein